MNILKTAKNLRFALVALALGLPLSAHAEDAGKALFVYGQAFVVSPDGERDALTKGETVESGDKVVTSVNGRVQLRMADGGLLAISPNSEFLIEDFNYAAGQGAERVASNNESRSFYVLLKGGFRSITGAIGKEDKAAYRVRTPVATIGIRGTDYTAVFCSGDCVGGKRDGLYVSVAQGGVFMKNEVGMLNLEPGDFGFVAGPNSKPVRTAVSAEAIAEERGSADEQKSAEVAPTSTSGENLLGGGSGQSGAVAMAAGPLGSAASQTDVSLGSPELAADGSVQSFNAEFPGSGDANYDAGNAQVVDRGEDPNTGIRWGRWANGNADVTTDEGTQQVALQGSSLHWVAGGLGEARPVVPTTGSKSFSLVGNTNPTDNMGNVGVLGSAELSADFDAQTVDAEVGLSVNNQNWDASADDVALDGDSATFEGDFDSVTITDVSDPANPSSASGDGSLSGFFTGDENGDIDGAGMGYSLTDNAGTTVSGSAAFQADTPPGDR